MTTPNYTKNTIVQPDDKIHFEDRPEFGIEKKIEEEKEEMTVKKKPIVSIDEFETFVIRVQTKDAYQLLMKVIEYAGYEDANHKKPTKTNYWKIHKENSCVFLYTGFEKKYFDMFNYNQANEEMRIYQPLEFYIDQSINIDEIFNSQI